MLLARMAPERKRCPYCESCLHTRLQRKWLLIEARQCAHCGLIFRYPTDVMADTGRFYSGAYSGQHATDLPSDAALDALLASNFRGSAWDKSSRIEFLKRLQAQGRALDFGASFGYGVYQLRAAGYDASGFELSEVRAGFGRKRLGVTLHTSWDSLLAGSEGSYDLIYCDHSLEHVPELHTPLSHFATLLRSGALLVVFVPNCGGLLGRRLGTGWGPFLGEAHTMAFTAEWFSRNLPKQGFSIVGLSSSMEGGADLDGEELVCVARRV